MGKWLLKISRGRGRLWLARRRWEALAGGAGVLVVAAALAVWFGTSHQPVGPMALMQTEVKTHRPSQAPDHSRAAVSAISVRPSGEQAKEGPAPAASHVVHGPTGPTFDGRPLKPVRTLTMTVTAYSPDARSCGKFADGVTASGYSVWTNGMKLVAADTRRLAFGTILTIPGYSGGDPVPVLDRGGAIKGNHLDVMFPNHEAAMQWGVRRLKVRVWEYADAR